MCFWEHYCLFFFFRSNYGSNIKHGPWGLSDLLLSCRGTCFYGSHLDTCWPPGLWAHWDSAHRMSPVLWLNADGASRNGGHLTAHVTHICSVHPHASLFYLPIGLHLQHKVKWQENIKPCSPSDSSPVDHLSHMPMTLALMMFNGFLPREASASSSLHWGNTVTRLTGCSCV